MHRFLIVLAIMLTPALPAQAEPLLKIINFTADWCPNCQILNPRIDEAISNFGPNKLELINLDLTKAGRGAPMAQSARAVDEAKALAEAHRVSPLWEAYGGLTGLAIIVASDTGEMITCVMRPMSTHKIEEKLRLAALLTENAAPGSRALAHATDCPPPRRF